jgi:hypothetical protein
MFRNVDRDRDHDHEQHRHHRHEDDNNHSGNPSNNTPTFTVLPGLASTDPVPGFEIPPDNALAASGGFLVQAVNAVVEWTTSDGGSVVEKPMSEFYASLGAFNGNFYLDPRALYNDATEQFVVSAGADLGSEAHLLVAVSNDSNPNDGFKFYDYEYADTNGIDQPNLAIDGSTLFMASTAGLNNNQQLLVGDLNGGPTKEVSLGSGSSLIYKQVANQGTGDYAVAQNSGTLTLEHVTTAGVIDGKSSVNLGNISSDYGEQYLPTQGETIPIDAGDSRIYGLALQGNTLWTTFEVTPTSGPDAGVANTHWAELDVSDPSHVSLIDQGTVSGSTISAHVGTSTGSVGIDKAGDVIMNFVASGPDMVPTDYFEIKAVGDTAFSAPIKWDASVGPYVEPNAGPFGPEVASRWGDYSSAIADPNNPHAFYISNEVGVKAGSFDYASPIAHVVIPTATV